MAESVYKVVELVGKSTESWEKAAAAAVERASKSLRDLRVAEVVEQDLVIEKGKVEAYRTNLKVSFKYDGKDERAPGPGAGRARRVLGPSMASGPFVARMHPPRSTTTTCPGKSSIPAPV